MAKKAKDSGRFIRWFKNLRVSDVPIVGGKNASLGEMIGTLNKKGIRVPAGFATTAEAYREFLRHNDLNKIIRARMNDYKNKKMSLKKAGDDIRAHISKGSFPPSLENEIRDAYHDFCLESGIKDVPVAVRSSATAEDLPEASFAGQQETFLNISGISQVLEMCRRCFASLFTNRAIVYREEKGFDALQVALSVGIQRMVRSDKAGAGVMFSIDTETGFPETVVINAAWGLGESVVQGSVNPDEYLVFKPFLEKKKINPVLRKSRGAKEKKIIYSSKKGRTTETVPTSKEEQTSFVLSDAEIRKLAAWGCLIEKHYGKPMDMEWAKDGETGEIFIVQARPETVQALKKRDVFKTYHLKEKGRVLATGLAIGEAITTGPVCVIKSAKQINLFKEGSILVTGKTDPDWVPIMKKASAIITDFGGRTSHAAIVSRELGLPALIGTSNATSNLKPGQTVTVSCAEGSKGFVYEGKLDYEESEVKLDDLPETRTEILMNIASPQAAFTWWRLPVDGVGLARIEFIINNAIKIHPMALCETERVKNRTERAQIEALTRGWSNRSDFFVDQLASGIAMIAASRYPKPVIVRLSDFKTNEYADLIGGKYFEEHEDNPMLGFRGASRYTSDKYRKAFALECRALKMAREKMGFTNIVAMIPFCRTPEEADDVLKIMVKNGLTRGENGLQIYVMAEIPSNVFLASEFASRFDGFSIGSNDLTQLVLGVDRDSAVLASLFDERHAAVKAAIRILLQKARESGTKAGICGQAPSDYPEFAEFLVTEGIDSISLNPDSVANVIRRVAAKEKELQTVPKDAIPRIMQDENGIQPESTLH